MKITNMQLLNMSNKIAELVSNKSVLPTQFVYGLLKNKNIIKADLDLLEEFKKPDDKLVEYERKRIDLNIKFSAKDSSDSPIIKDNMYEIEDMEGFSKEYEKLNKEYKDTLDEATKKSEEYIKLLEQEIDINFYEIKSTYLPSEIAIDVLEAIMPLISD